MVSALNEETRPGEHLGEAQWIVGQRVDALTLGMRVRLDASFVRRLRERADVAARHGRASFEYEVRVPDRPLAPRAKRLGLDPKAGCVSASFADYVADSHVVRKETKSWGELRFSRSAEKWVIVNEPFFQIMVDLRAPGANGERERCKICDGYGGWREVENGRTWDGENGRFRLTRIHTNGRGWVPCTECDGDGSIAVCGWTVEIVWRAETLARWGLPRVLEEASALASAMGELREVRVRRIDLACDVAGWALASSLVKRLAKRSRASCGIFDDAGREERQKLKACQCNERECICANIWVGEVGNLDGRRITGVAVGRGGDVSCRLYDKRTEMARDTSGSGKEKIAREESVWCANGWDGASPVTRVEFQIRGAAIAEFGIRDPFATMRLKGQKRKKEEGQPPEPDLREWVPAFVKDEHTGELRAAELPDRLDDLWSVLTEWLRVVVPSRTRTGRMRPTSRLELDARWTLVRSARFGRGAAQPMTRKRVRGLATEAQALGVMLSQIARDQRLLEAVPESGYDPVTAEAFIRRMVKEASDATAETVIAHLMLREEQLPTSGAVHLAVRVNAARARFLEYDARPKPPARAGLPPPRFVAA